MIQGMCPFIKKKIPENKFRGQIPSGQIRAATKPRANFSPLVISIEKVQYSVFDLGAEILTTQ